MLRIWQYRPRCYDSQRARRLRSLWSMQVKLQAEFALDESRQQIWAKLFDPPVLKSCIPGCERLDRVAEDTFELTASVGISVVRGRFTGRVSIRDAVEPESLRLVGEGKGGPGFVRGEARITLQQCAEGTLVRVDADAEVGGILARLGQRALVPVARILLDQFFGCLQRKL